MKTNIKPIMNQLLKSKRIIIERNQDNYYICDGFIIMKVSEKLYNDSVKSINDLFITLEEGQSIQYFNKYYSNNNKDNSIKLKELYDSYIESLEFECSITPFLYKSRYNKITARIIKTNNTLCLFDNNKIESALKLNASCINIKRVKNIFNIIFFNGSNFSVGFLQLAENDMFYSDFENLKEVF